MVASKVTGGRAWGATGAAILRVDLPKNMTVKEFLEINRRTRNGGGSDADKAVIREVFHNAVLRQSGEGKDFQGSATALDMPKSKNKKHIKKQESNLKARRKEERDAVQSRVEASFQAKYDRLEKAMNSAKTVTDLENNVRPLIDKFWSVYPKVDPSKVVQRFDKGENSAYFNKAENRYYKSDEINESPKIKAAIRREKAIQSKRLRTAQAIEKQWDSAQEKYGNKLESLYSKLENDLPVGD